MCLKNINGILQPVKYKILNDCEALLQKEARDSCCLAFTN